MKRKLLSVLTAAVLVVAGATGVATAGGGGSNSGGGGGGGGGKAVKFVGIVTAIDEFGDITVGTSYYMTGIAATTSSTKYVRNGSNCTFAEIEIGDTATLTVEYSLTLGMWVATKVEAFGVP